jgi:penicillin-binding protein 1C
VTRRTRALLLTLAAGVIGALTWVFWPVELPVAPASPRLEDRHGELLASRPEPGTAAGAPVTELPQNIADALVAAEDHRFRSHPGVDPIGIGRAVRANLQAGHVVQGGSTIPQQLVRSLWPRPPGLRGKAWEAAWAVRLDAQLDKDTLLLEYANRLYFGHLATGIDAASHVYFGQDPSALSVSEAALLAALPRAPSRLDPWRNPDAALAARDRVLQRMHDTDVLDDAGLALALAEPVQLAHVAPSEHAPHFVRWLDAGPGTTQTTLDLGLQRDVEALVAHHVAELEDHNVHHAAVVVLDTRTNQVLAYVGSADWRAADGQVDGAQALRSPGSALKPFTYQLGLESRDMTLASVISDLPGTWATTHGSWAPRNYDESYWGPIRAREALATSRNLPAVRVLEQVGVAELHRRLVDLGLTSLDQRPAHYGLGLTLGTAEARLIELTAAYAALGRGGRVLPVQTRMDAPRPDARQVGEAAAAWLILDALDDPDARARAFGVDSVLEPDFPLAAKTGTSVGYRDNWAMAVTPQVTVGVWVGNFDGSPMVRVSGVTGAGPLMRAVVEAAHDRDAGDQAFPKPRGIVQRPICPVSGMAPSDACATTVRERFLAGTQPETPDTWIQDVQVHPDGALGTGCPGTRTVRVIDWPAEYVAWAQAAEQPRWPEVDRACVETATADPTGSAILQPADGVSFWIEGDRPLEQQAIALVAAAPGRAREAVWRVDGQVVATVGPPFRARWLPTPGMHVVTLHVDGHPAGSAQVWVGASVDPQGEFQ